MSGAPTSLVADLVAELDARLRELGTPERAAKEKAYLHSDLAFYGVVVPDLRAAVKASLKAHDPDRDGVLAAVDLLWAQPVHERRTAATMFLVQREGLLEFEDLALVERLIRDSRTWALVDVLAGDVTGKLAMRFDAAAVTAVLDRWAADGDFWVRRSALLAHLLPLRADDITWPRFTRYADAMLEEKEFFIRKAIGWVLREVARRRPDQVFDWLLPRADLASGVTVREAVKYLPASQAAEISARR